MVGYMPLKMVQMDNQRTFLVSKSVIQCFVELIMSLLLRTFVCQFLVAEMNCKQFQANDVGHIVRIELFCGVANECCI